jgi:hypothetical protein
MPACKHDPELLDVLGSDDMKINNNTGGKGNDVLPGLSMPAYIDETDYEDPWNEDPLAYAYLDAPQLVADNLWNEDPAQCDEHDAPSAHDRDPPKNEAMEDCVGYTEMPGCDGWPVHMVIASQSSYEPPVPEKSISFRCWQDVTQSILKFADANAGAKVRTWHYSGQGYYEGYEWELASVIVDPDLKKRLPDDITVYSDDDRLFVALTMRFANFLSR